MNPLFDDSQQQHGKPAPDGYVLPRGQNKYIQPPSDTRTPEDKQAAIELIRRKLDSLYDTEPDARKEIKETEVIQPTARSRHQQFMHELSSSGKPLAEIQTAWHNYYAGLSDTEKHEVWREFYEHSGQGSPAYQKAAETHHTAAATRAPHHKTEKTLPEASLPQLHPETAEDKRPKVVVAEHTPPVASKQPTKRRARLQKIHRHIKQKVQLSAAQQQKARQHLHSLLFGIGTGVVVILVFLFSFFNEMIIAPFIQPSRTVSSTPIILSSDSVVASETPEVIIPKINVQIPVVYDEPSLEEDAIQRALERGVIHYASTSLPGEQGNAAIFGHSSNNIFNKGKYKFAFVQLQELVPGDIFYLTRDKKAYAYRVYDKRVVTPTQTEVLRPVEGKPATATLITCDPPGTSKFRLVVWGEQISPDPSTAAVAQAPPQTTPAQLPSEGPTLWRRMTNWLF